MPKARVTVVVVDGKKKHTPTYNTWHSMIQRCQNPHNDNYPRYGARGITVCERWRKFLPFLADMGERPEGMTLERIDNDGPYCPENCRWATRLEQQQNNRLTRKLTHNGITASVREWAEILGISYTALFLRLKRKWPLERALAPNEPGRSRAPRSDRVSNS